MGGHIPSFGQDSDVAQVKREIAELDAQIPESLRMESILTWVPASSVPSSTDSGPPVDDVTEMPAPGDPPDPATGMEVAPLSGASPPSPLPPPWDDPSFGLVTTPELQLELLRIAQEAEDAEDAARLANNQDDPLTDSRDKSLALLVRKL
jgi:hypothetical protein